MSIAMWICGAGIVAGLGLILWGCLAMAGRQDENWGDK